MQEVVRYTIKLNPVTKKNHQQLVGIGSVCPTCHKKERTVPIQSKQYKQYEKDSGMFLLRRPTKPIWFPINICCTFYMATKRSIDSTNLIAAVDDILVKYKIIQDDNRDIVVAHDGSRVMYDKENPRTEIVITRVPDYDQWKGQVK